MTRKNKDRQEYVKTDMLRCIYDVYVRENLDQIRKLETRLEKILSKSSVIKKIRNLPFRDADRVEARRIGYETAIRDQLYKIYGTKNKTKIKTFEDAIEKLILNFGEDVIYGARLEETK